MFVGKYEGTIVAIKLLLGVDSAALQRFQWEVDMLAGASSEGSASCVVLKTSWSLLLVLSSLKTWSTLDNVLSGNCRSLNDLLVTIQAMASFL